MAASLPGQGNTHAHTRTHTHTHGRVVPSRSASQSHSFPEAGGRECPACRSPTKQGGQQAHARERGRVSAGERGLARDADQKGSNIKRVDRADIKAAAHGSNHKTTKPQNHTNNKKKKKKKKKREPTTMRRTCQRMYCQSKWPTKSDLVVKAYGCTSTFARVIVFMKVDLPTFGYPVISRVWTHPWGGKRGVVDHRGQRHDGLGTRGGHSNKEAPQRQQKGVASFHPRFSNNKK